MCICMYISIYREKEREELAFPYYYFIPRFATSVSLRTGKD